MPSMCVEILRQKWHCKQEINENTCFCSRSAVFFGLSRVTMYLAQDACLLSFTDKKAVQVWIYQRR